MFKLISELISEFTGEKHEVTDSIREALRDRVNSPFYGYFVISWFIVNWDFIYSALFVDGSLIYEKTKLLKNEYLLQIILPTHYSFQYWWAFIIFPLILTFIALWPMQMMTRFFYKRHIDNKIADEKIKSDAFTAKIESDIKVLEAEVKQAKVEKEAIKVSPELVWHQEYNDFKKHQLFHKFKQIITCIYSYSGSIHINEYFAR